MDMFKQAYSLSTDIRVAPRWSLDLEGGAFFDSRNFAYYKGESYKGLRLRTGGKFILRNSVNQAPYFGLWLKYNQIDHFRYRDILRQGAQYQETYLLERNVESFGLAGRFGFQVYLGKKDQFIFEPYLGAGALFHNTRYKLPADAELLEFDALFDPTLPLGRTTYPDFFIGIYIGYAIW